MDLNKIRMCKMRDWNSSSRPESVETFRGKEEIDALWKIFTPRKDTLTWGTEQCLCGSRSGLVEHDGQFYAMCSKCDRLVVRGNNREEVIMKWAQETIEHPA